MKTITELMNKIKDNLGIIKKEDQEKITRNMKDFSDQAEELGQSRLLAELDYEYKYYQKELTKALPAGYDTYVDLFYLRKLLKQLNDKKEANLNLVQLEDYTHPIPTEPYTEIKKAKGIFDTIYILFTDYSDETNTQAEVERDPIAFGEFSIEDNNNQFYYNKRLHFIVDWEDEYCDLTLHKLIEMSNSIGMPSYQLHKSIKNTVENNVHGKFKQD